MPRLASTHGVAVAAALLAMLLASGHGPVRAESDAATPGCFGVGCHAEPTSGHIPFHAPYYELQCLSCHVDHNPDGEDSPMLMKSGGDALCLDCHAELKRDDMGAMAHPPGDEDCLACHAPHQSPVRGLLRSDERLAECAQCHADFLEAGAAMPHSHGFFNPRSQCGNCHYAHHAGEGPFLRPEVAQTCLTCHDLPIERTTGRDLPNIARELRTRPHVHGAMTGGDGACEACHTPHGSVQPSLLKAGYPAGNYAEEGGLERFALCWGCHDEELVTSGWPVPRTGFRDGGTNLHGRHISGLKRGRACHLCHAPHTSEKPFLMRESMRMGTWEGAIGFEALPEGGRCTTPCHKPAEYSRAAASAAPSPSLTPAP